MAHFIGYVQGRSKTTASRLGTKTTGLTARAQGWDIGGEVTMSHDSKGRDCVTFRLTCGSNNPTTYDAVTAVTYCLNPDGTVTREV